MITPMMRRRPVALLGAAALMLFGAACAEKAFNPPTRMFDPTVRLQLIAPPANQVSGAQVVLVAAGFTPPGDNGSSGNSGGGSDDFQPIVIKQIALTAGTQSVPLDVDISLCVSVFASAGKDACELKLAVALLGAAVDTTKDVDPLADSYDYAFPLGPFLVGPGRTPVIDPIDLSATRWGAVAWVGDDALKLGGGNTPSNSGQGVQGLTSPIAGAFVGTAPPTLFTLTNGTIETPGVGPNGQTQVQGPVPQLAIFENGAWRRVSPVGISPGAQSFSDVTAVSPTEAYVAHRTGLYKYDGTTLTRVPAVTDTILSVGHVSGAGGKMVIAGATNAIWIGNGTAFTRYVPPVNQRWDGVCINGPTEAFASSTSVGGGIVRFNGTAWISVPAPAQAAKVDLQCTGLGQAFVIANVVGIFRWNGSGWTQLPGLPVFNIRRVRIAAVGPNEIYAAGDSALVDRAFYRFDGTSWTETSRLRLTFGNGRPWADPRGGTAYWTSSQYGFLNRQTATSASVISYMPSLRDVWVNSSTSAFAVGNARFIGRWDGSKWTVDPPPANRRTLLSLNGVWSDGPSRAWAVGQQSTIMHWNGSSWFVATDSLNPGGPAGEYHAVWGTGTSAWAAGDQGVSHCTVGAGCTLSQGLGGPLYGIWGSAANNIWAVGANGRIMNYNGTSWTSVTSPTNRKLVKISGSAANDIWAVGDSVLLRFNGTQWTNHPMVEDLVQMQSAVPTAQFAQPSIGLFVRNPREAYLGSQFGRMARWDGQKWRELNPMPYVRRIVAISMSPTGCALAVTETESTPPQAAPTLWRGVSPTGCFATSMTPPAIWP